MTNLDWPRIRAAFDPKAKQDAFNAWKASLRRKPIPPPPEGMRTPMYVYDRETEELMDILDLGSSHNCEGGWHGHCGGCDACMYMQTSDKHYHILSYESAVEMFS